MKRHLAAILNSDVVGSLGRDVAVELVDVSRSGCLLHSPVVVPVGTLGILSLEIDGELYTDDVRVARCLRVPGASERHHIGVEFLPMRRPGRDSLRCYAASLGKGTDGVEVPAAVRLRLFS